MAALPLRHWLEPSRGSSNWDLGKCLYKGQDNGTSVVIEMRRPVILHGLFESPKVLGLDSVGLLIIGISVEKEAS